MKKLPILCPQEYTGFTMSVTPCSRCRQWDPSGNRCIVDTGAEHLPDEPADKIPECPIQNRCQHQLQAPDGICVVRHKGLICESALVYSGLDRGDAMDHPLSFHAQVVASPEEIADYMAEQGEDPEKIAAYLTKWGA